MTTATDTSMLLEELRSLADGDEWHTLPPGVYCSDEVWALETERIFGPGWLNVGHISEVPNAGDFKAVDVLGEPMVMTRDRNGLINVLSRVCTHRWMDVCGGPGSGSAPSLQCPYHRWTFGLEGGLRAAPEMADTPGFDKTEHGLHRFRHDIWEGFVFVNIDGTAPPAAELWAPLSAQLANYRLADWTVVHSLHWGESPWDWKVFIDNGECYHHLGAHSDTLEPIMPARLVVDADDNGAFTLLYAGITPEALVQGEDGRSRYPGQDPPLPGLDDEQLTSLGLAHPFPNYVLAIMPQAAIWFEVHPLGPGRLDLTTHILLPPHLVDAPGRDERIQSQVEALSAVHEQDIAMCTAVQRGLSAGAARRGMLCHLERHNRTFARWYARQMTR